MVLVVLMTANVVTVVSALHGDDYGDDDDNDDGDIALKDIVVFTL